MGSGDLESQHCNLPDSVSLNPSGRHSSGILVYTGNSTAVAEVCRGYLCESAYQGVGKGTRWPLLGLSCRPPRARTSGTRGPAKARAATGEDRGSAHVRIQVCVCARTRRGVCACLCVCDDNQGHHLAQLQNQHLLCLLRRSIRHSHQTQPPLPASVLPAQALSCCSFKLRRRQEKAQRIPSGCEWLLRL